MAALHMNDPPAHPFQSIHVTLLREPVSKVQGRNLGLDQFILLMALPLQVISGLNLMRAVAHRNNDLGLDAARLRRSRSRMIPPIDSTVFVVVGRPRGG